MSKEKIIEKFKKLEYFLLGNYKEYDYLTQMLKLATLITLLASIYILVFNVAITDNKLIHYFSYTFLLLYFCAYLFARYNTNYIVILYSQVIITLFLISFNWYLFEGFSGSTYYVFLTFNTFYAVLTRGIHTYIVLASSIILVFVLFYLEANKIVQVMPYFSQQERINDAQFTVVLAIIFIFLTVKMLNRKNINSIILTEEYKILEENNLKITEQNSQLKELNKTKDKFFSIISHDIKNPIYAINNMHELINSDLDAFSKEELQDIIQILNKSSKNLYYLIENLLTWSRIQTGKIEPSRQDFNLTDIINNNIDILDASAQRKSINILNKSFVQIMVHCDMNQISTIIRNLLSNAIKFSRHNSQITINCLVEENEIIVSIQDCGFGMDKEQLKKLFAIESNNSTLGSDGETGTGLGLILCREFIELNNGKIWAESEVGKGSTFYFSLPN